MCNRFEICGNRHGRNINKYTKRNPRSGRYQRNYLFSHLMFFATVIGLVAGLPYIAGQEAYYMIKNSSNIFTVQNIQAEEVITDEDILEARIARLVNIIYQKAKIYGVSGYQMERTVECESRFNNVQSSAKDPSGPNGREDSWGIAQIHLPSHPYIGREDAMTEEFAIEWMAKNFNSPHVTWYAYNRKTDRCN